MGRYGRPFDLRIGRNGCQYEVAARKRPLANAARLGHQVELAGACLSVTLG